MDKKTVATKALGRKKSVIESLVWFCGGAFFVKEGGLYIADIPIVSAAENFAAFLTIALIIFLVGLLLALEAINHLILVHLREGLVHRATALTRRLIRLKYIIGSVISFGAGVLLIWMGGIYIGDNNQMISADKTPVEFWTIVSVLFSVGLYLVYITLQVRRSGKKSV